ncbi:hypothetical protein J5289_20260 [Rhizobium sp. B230/85]|uniref:hypothetical protein n=1 Tax=unclassified Rhizobium TaxID=2613769 RepID=UPI001ADA4D5A|nr:MULTISPECIES: hypothetical protein [unclassified Rhizobium]MBO9135328.1 hypothetical protein [Rhizobium sp. B209b/85]MBO9171555.1 hypothetical protein [Rhizobium sp. L245/93]QXZ98865.1 hypothetical protein J5289_20260 [Rhizobium sp. B230/85]
MTINRFEGLAAELNRLAVEIAAINSQPFNVGIDLGAEALISGTVDEPSRMEPTSLSRLDYSLRTPQ